MMKTWALVAAAAMGLTACQNDYEEQIEAKDKVVVSFLADAAEGRTSVNTEGEAPVFAWDDAESFAVLEQTDKLAVATDVNFSKKENGSAEITAAFDYYEYAEGYKYVAVYPETGYVSGDFAEATLTLPAEQTMVAGSYDPAADLMVSKVVATDQQPTEIQPLRFTRLAAVAKMNFRGIEAGEKVESVVFQAKGKTLAGNVTASLETPYEFTVAEGGSNSVTVKAAGEGAVYFTLLPTTLEVGDTFTVAVATDKYLYVKEGTIADKALEFAAGMVTRFGVDLTDIDPSDKWTLVRDVKDIKAGDVVTIASDASSVVMGAKYNSSYYPYGSQTNVVKVGDYLYHPITPEGTTDGKSVIQQLVVLQPDEAKDAFYFYNGVDYDGDSKNGFLRVEYSNKLSLQDNLDANSLFYVDIDSESGVASIVATDSEEDNKYVYYYPSASLTSRSFRTKDSAPAVNQHVRIYKIPGAKGIVDASFSAPTNITLTNEAATNAIFEDVVFNYVDGWTISVENVDSREWISVWYDNGKLKYTVEANNDYKYRQAYITITAKREGKEDITENVWIYQKGQIMPIAISELKNQSIIDYNEYRVTGILATKATKESGTTTLRDINGNEAKFTYIHTTDGKTFHDNSDDVNVGDVVTIVGVITGKSGDVATLGDKDDPAIYEGYYNFSLEVDPDHIPYTGGSTEITITKKGTLEPSAITMTPSFVASEEEFAEIEYNGGEKATVTFEANNGAPRMVSVIVTDGYYQTNIIAVQGADDSKGLTWERVTDASTLRAGDRVIIGATDVSMAMSTQLYNGADETSTSAKRSAAIATRLGKYYIETNDAVQQFVLMNGSVANTFAFYDEARKAFLVSTNKTSKYLINQPYIDENASFAISIADGIATVGNVEGTYSENKLWYHSDMYFYSGTTESEAICLYRLAGVTNPIVPVAPASVTVPEADEYVVVAEEGVAAATAIEEVVFNHVGDWAISVSTEAEWLNVNYADGKLTYTADANTSIVREATVTITATHEGEENLTWSFGVLQKGSALEISIADFIAKPVDVNVEYKITGRVKVVPSSNSSSATYEIEDEDGNVAKATYFYTESDELVKTNDEIGLEVGDVVTITGAVAKTNGTIGGIANSVTYKATYKGHYRLTATVEPAIVSYEGGDATISVTLAKNGTLGTLCAPTAVIGSISDNDFATMTYTPDATSATVSFAANAGAPREAVVTFSSGLAEASVKVAQGSDPNNRVGWMLVTDKSELAVGDKIIIAGQNKDYAISTSNQSTNIRGVAISRVASSLLGVDESSVRVFTLMNGFKDGEFAITYVASDKTYYLYTDSATSDRLKVTQELIYNSSWTIDIDGNGGAFIDTTYGTTTPTTRRIMLNYTDSNQTFVTYKTSTTNKEPVCIYKYYE